MLFRSGTPIQSPGNAGSFLNGAGVNIRSGRGFGAVSGLSTQFQMSGTTLLLAGMGCTMTPLVSGTMYFSTSCQIATNVASGTTNACQIYGTGAVPAQGTNSNVGQGTGYGTSFEANANTGGCWMPWSQMSIVATLTIGTQYWGDIAISVPGGGGSGFAMWGMVWMAEF